VKELKTGRFALAFDSRAMMEGAANGRPTSDDSTVIEEPLPEHFYSSLWPWYMTMELLLDEYVCLLPL
jgi:hypothetical protein